MSEKHVDTKVIGDVSETEKGSASPDFEHGQVENLEEQFTEVHKVRQGLHQRHIQVSNPISNKIPLLQE